MPDLLIHPSGPLRGTIAVPGDKSITHRALMLASLAEGTTVIEGWVPAEVCLATLRCMTALGAQFDDQGDALVAHGAGMHGLREPTDVLHCAGSGTTMRLLAGLVAGQPFTSILTGTEPLRRRPMARVAEPLRLMGATVLGRQEGRLPPLAIRGGALRGIEYRLPIASAQVKSAILLAGLFAAGHTVIHEPGPSRDHTERILRFFGFHVRVDGQTVDVKGGQTGSSPHDETTRSLQVPGDFSSAAFPMVAAAIIPGSDIRLAGVGVNPTRTGLFELMVGMRAELDMIHCGDPGVHSPDFAGEPRADLVVRTSTLRGVEVGGDLVVRAIDEFPIFAVLATQAEGITVVRDAQELRVKESDRIASVATELRKMGAQIEEQPDGMIIRGPTRLHGAEVDCHRDHRLAMALAIAGLVARGPTTVRGAEAVDDSFPGFVEIMRTLGASISWAEGLERRHQ